MSILTDEGYPVFGANGIIGYYSEYNHEKPTLVITCRGATCGTVSITEPFSYITGNAMALDEIDESKVNLRFLYHQLKNRGFSDVISGSAQPQITGQGLASVKITLPCLMEQKRIAAILDKADAIRRKREKAIELSDSFLKSVFLEMFGDPVSNPHGWSIEPLSALLDRNLQSGAYFSKDFYTNDLSGIEMVHMSDAFYGEVSFENIKRVAVDESQVKKYGLTDDDILLARRSLNFEGAAKPCLIPKISRPLIFESSLIRVRPDRLRLHPIYLYFYLSDERVRKQYLLKHITQSTISGINQGNLNRVEIILPPIELQEKFVSIFKKCNQLREKMDIDFEKLNTLFSSISNNYFNFYQE